MIVSHEVGPQTSALVREHVMRQVFPPRPDAMIRSPDVTDQLLALEWYHGPAARLLIWWAMIRDGVPPAVILAHARAMVFSLRSVTV